MEEIMSDIAEIGPPAFFEIEFWPSEKKPREIYVVVDGRRIAHRGHPDTPQAGTWVAIDKHYHVEGDHTHIVIEYVA
jgi:hypothetical protein